MSFYSIYIPTINETDVNDRPYVFTEIEEALKVLKNHKDARLKAFKTSEDAQIYAHTGYEDYQPKLAHLKSPTPIVEKAAFRAPTKQELVLLRKAIEDDRFDAVEKTIWDNPRYLVNSGDTPTSLKEGTRYNAMHVCALHNRAKIADLILQTIRTDRFIELLHGKSNSKICQEVSEILLDYYLNMPEKGRNETPLHLAAKYGAVDVVEVLTTYPQCKMTPNLENLLAKDIICSRMNEPSAELKNKISSLLEERFYVPVIRSVDNTIPPLIGDPFSPTNPPEFNKDPKSPDLEIRAYAGPMSKEQAQSFRRRWKTPPRVGTPNSSIVNSPYITPIKIRSSTPAKSVNNNSTSPSIYGRDHFLTNNSLAMNSQDAENANYSNEKKTNEFENNNGNQSQKPSYTSLTPLRKNPLKRDLFFTYRDKGISPLVFDTDDWPSVNNSEIVEKDICETPGWKERHVKLSDTEKGLELIGRELAKEHRVDWNEYWDFLGCFVNISSAEGLDKLETHLAKRQKGAEINKISKEDCLLKNMFDEFGKIQLDGEKTEKVDRRLPNKIREDTAPNSHSTTPYLCVEKSLQVFAKRMTKTILHNIKSVVSINDALNSELKRLKSLICSFKDDERFFIVDFRVVHSRFAKLIVDYLKNSADMNADKMNKIKTSFLKIVESKQKSERVKGMLEDRRNKLCDTKEQLQCVVENILKDLERNEERILPENLKTEDICANTWQKEIACNCIWVSVANRQTSRRKKSQSIKIFSKNVIAYDVPCNSEEGPEEHRDADTFHNINDFSADTFSDVEDEEDDIFWSDIGSEEEEETYYTPPDSPSILECYISNDVFEGYNVYLLGNEPTKRDLDVLNALFNVEIDRETYPNIHRWRAAVLRHPNEERDNFPSPSVIIKGGSYFQRPDEDRIVPRRLFMSPRDHRRIERSRTDSPMSSPGSSASKSLSFMNVSNI